MAADWRVNNFDLIRLLAALQVAATHSLEFFRPSTAPWYAVLVRMLGLLPGVPIFFIVSGFLLAQSYGCSPDLRNYLRNRCLRIFPALWVHLVAALAVILATGVTASTLTTRDWLLWWFGQMTLFQGQGAPLPAGWVYLGMGLWTIAVELEFYLVLPAALCLAQIANLRSRALLVVLFLASFAIQYHLTGLRVLSDGQVVLLTTLVPYLWMFLVGVLMQLGWPRLRPYLAGHATWWLAAYLGACLVFWRLRVPITAGTVWLNPVCLLLLAATTLSFAFTVPNLARRLLRERDVSYGLYLYHGLVLLLVQQLGALAGWAGLAMVLVLGVIVASLSWRYVERPFLAHKRHALHPVYSAHHGFA
ncbi:MAG: acyltransferase [Proteobacteria bacterium]|nr:acyltransferase [Pseudomonadota bacterium]